MHTAVDRDDYIAIAWNNIQDEAKFNFKKYTNRVSMFNTGYDYGSIMHYGEMSFSKDKSNPTIIARKKKRRHEKLGQRESTLSTSARC
jgi:orotate phosphoribosyltransferase